MSQNIQFKKLKDFLSCNDFNLKQITIDLNYACLYYDELLSLGSSITKQEQLNHLQLKLEENQIGDEGAISLSKYFLNCNSLNSLELYLNNNDIGDEGAFSLASNLTNCKNLTKLLIILSENDLKSQGITDIGSAISKYENLQTFYFCFYPKYCFPFWHGVQTIVSNEQIDSWADAATNLGIGISICQNLQNVFIDLRYNSIGAKGAQGLCIGLAKCQKLTSLTLILEHNYVCDNGLLLILSELKKCQNLILLGLYLEYNYFTDLGLLNAIEQFSSYQKLRELHFNVLELDQRYLKSFCRKFIIKKSQHLVSIK
ncbi:hypothetical protein ABPG73_005620 [Tetrahymena malaccensis]